MAEPGIGDELPAVITSDGRVLPPSLWNAGPGLRRQRRAAVGSVRRRRPGLGAGRAVGGRLRRVRGPARPAGRTGESRRPGELEPDDPKLPGLRRRRQRRRAARSSLGTGVAVRRPFADRSASRCDPRRWGRTGRRVRRRIDGAGQSTVVASGLAYRRIGIPSVERLVGRGVFYGSGATEAQAMAGQPVAVIGGANSAAEAAIHLAKYADRSPCWSTANRSRGACRTTSSSSSGTSRTSGAARHRGRRRA